MNHYFFIHSSADGHLQPTLLKQCILFITLVFVNLDLCHSWIKGRRSQSCKDLQNPKTARLSLFSSRWISLHMEFLVFPFGVVAAHEFMPFLQCPFSPVVLVYSHESFKTCSSCRFCLDFLHLPKPGSFRPAYIFFVCDKQASTFVFISLPLTKL